MNDKSLIWMVRECLKALEQAKVDYEFAQEEVTRCEQLTQDYLHKLELEEPGYHEGARIAREIGQCRIERREAKDKISRCQPVVDFLNAEKGKAAIGQFQQLLGALRKTETQISCRTYVPRVLSQQEYKGEAGK